MCTTGIVSDRSDQWLLGFKTLDAGPTGVWHGQVHFPSGIRVLGVGITVQLGINSGLNSRGLCSILSYLDTVIPSKKPKTDDGGWYGDNRGLANAAMLAECETVREGYNFLQAYFRRFPSQVGGNFLLADRFGHMGVVEYYHEVVRFAGSEGSPIVRANNGCLVGQTEQQQLPPDVQFDRNGRYTIAYSATASLPHLPKEKAIDHIQTLLADHGNAEIPPICVHDYDVPGSRYARPGSISTVTAVIFDVYSSRMMFTRGPACKSSWESLAFSEVLT
ncbi:hypothetical protein [Sulfobacillus thermosulfidooxidans]|uniref:hypothetical protein n=1 Tax=Sulfobacillus thermosulfidooxidans TaxID=28034 RepID=UPI0004161677|nr:hypothetical protein [Sulfobacillus thermosulfidooxidans]